MNSESNMYPRTRTWNPFKGCRFDCTYCKPSFKRQAKRRKQDCMKCYRYEPHCHENRLTGSVPSTPIVFVAGGADIAFCPRGFTRKIIERIKQNSRRSRRLKTFYFQSKRPKYFEPFLSEFPDNVVLLTTLETNRDKGYRKISKAPPPSARYQQFKALDYPRKVVTIEPVMDFDLREFAGWIRSLRPEYVWLGFNSKAESVTIPEPSPEKVLKLMQMLTHAGIEIRGKELRGLAVPSS
ncbi:hypothetical protein ACFL5Q_02265 [Planctomycetota bacterium]